MTIRLDKREGKTTIEIAVLSSITFAKIAKQIVEKPRPKEPFIKAEKLRASRTKINRESAMVWKCKPSELRYDAYA